MEWVYMYVHFENQRYNPSKKRQLGLNTTRENIDKASAQYETKLWILKIFKCTVHLCTYWTQ